MANVQSPRARNCAVRVRRIRIINPREEEEMAPQLEIREMLAPVQQVQQPQVAAPAPKVRKCSLLQLILMIIFMVLLARFVCSLSLF